jgi:SAM-dependent methyltransferase/uncharacterized protein YbaR (Trm112 family)
MVAPLICPGCRTRTDDTIDLRTVERAGDVLACACGRRYPIVDGIPILVADARAIDIVAAIEAELPPEVAAALVAAGPDDAPYPRLLEHLSIYLDAHWGDRADPPAGFAAAAIIAKLAERPHVDQAVELGCSTGRIVAELAQRADHVVGVDLHVGSLRRARRLLDGETLTYNRRVSGRTYTTATVTAGDRAMTAARRALVCGDALDPPLVPGIYDRVVALNLLDAVRHPSLLLSVMDGLCSHGGEVILTSPYAWQSSTVEDGEMLDEAAVIAWLVGRGFVIEDQADLAWPLRRDARATFAYCVHYVRARKL